MEGLEDDENSKDELFGNPNHQIVVENNGSSDESSDNN